MSELIIIGGGIIGLCVAEKLVSQGQKVTLIEKERIAAGASYGNAGGFAFSEIIPMASYATILQAMRWFMDPSGPFSIILKDLPYTVNWLVRFALSARKSTYDRSLRVQSSLMQLGQATLPRMLERTGLSNMVYTSGALYLYDTMAQFDAAGKSWLLRKQQGIEYECLVGQELHDFQSGLSNDIYAGIHAPNYQSVTNPNDLCLGIHEYLNRSAVETIYAKESDIAPRCDGVEVKLEGGSTLKGAKVVVAAGPWSDELCKSLGDKVSMIGERGYNTTLPKSAMPDLNRPLFFGPHGFVMSPLSSGVRVGGASEIARIDRAANYRRSEALLRKAGVLVPGLKLTEGEQWMGLRPATPDTLPVIGCATRNSDVIYSFGHGHLGLTQATATAQLVSELVHGHPGSIELSSLSAQRF